jgi:hypothetical protein
MNIVHICLILPYTVHMYLFPTCIISPILNTGLDEYKICTGYMKGMYMKNHLKGLSGKNFYVN